MIKANPTREFFVNMLVRDILLKQAIIELIDNSIDGARTIKKDNDFTGLKIAVDFDGDSFCMQLLFLKYKDGAPMLTIGGILVDDELKDRIINSNILQKLIYCSRDNECFNIEVPKLTYKEIQLVLREIPITDKEYEENKERFHGIGLDEIRKFEKIYRYYPYYTEGCLNT